MKTVIETIKAEIENNNKFIKLYKESYLEASKAYAEAKDVSESWKETINKLAMSYLEGSLEYEDKNRLLENALSELEKY